MVLLYWWRKLFIERGWGKKTLAESVLKAALALIS